MTLMITVYYGIDSQTNAVRAQFSGGLYSPTGGCMGRYTLSYRCEYLISIQLTQFDSALR